MTTPRLPVLPRVGFALLTLLFVLALAAFVLLFFAVPDERWGFLLPMAGTLLGLTWTRGARRTWIDRHRTEPAGSPSEAEGA